MPITKEERAWLKSVLHPSCQKEAVSNSPLTTYFYSAVKELGNNPGKIYASDNAGMGYTIYAKRDYLGAPVYARMIQWDCPEGKAEIANFCRGYTEIKPTFNNFHNYHQPYSLWADG